MDVLRVRGPRHPGKPYCRGANAESNDGCCDEANYAARPFRLSSRCRISSATACLTIGVRATCNSGRAC